MRSSSEISTLISLPTRHPPSQALPSTAAQQLQDRIPAMAPSQEEPEGVDPGAGTRLHRDALGANESSGVVML